jgi:hypothetical protein
MIQDRTSPPRSTFSALSHRPSSTDDEPTSHRAPWLIRGHYSGLVSLDEEMTSRFPSMPVMSSIHFRPSGNVATLSTQDSAAVVSVQADEQSLELVYTLSSMLGQRFELDGLTDRDRSYWLDLLHSGDMPLVFLWGERRWQSDYLVWVPHRYFVNLYAFSPRQVEAAARLTTDVAQKLLDWIERAWTAPAELPAQNGW